MANASFEPERLPGTLVLVVGPSGAGKDTLIRLASTSLADDPSFVFPKRSITRGVRDDAEIHDSCTVDQFRQAVLDGGFLLSWEAHGLGYGIPVGAREHLVAGRTVVVNVSRTVVPAAAVRFPNLAVIHVTASAEELARRLRLRGREAADGISARLARLTDPLPTGIRLLTIDNSGRREDGAAAFVEALQTTQVSPA